MRSPARASRKGRLGVISAAAWDPVILEPPLCDAPFHFANLRNAPYLWQLVLHVLALTPRGARALEAGCGTGVCSIALSLRGVEAEGLDISPRIVERAKMLNNMLGGRARFRVGDLFTLHQDASAQGQSYQTIFSQGVLEHFTARQIRFLLAQQLAVSEWVVASVPSAFYTGGEFGDERKGTIEHWQFVLQPFENRLPIAYYGHPQAGERDHILMVLQGGDAAELEEWLQPPAPFEPGITLIVHTRNEERNLGDCLESARADHRLRHGEHGRHRGGGEAPGR